MVIKVLKSIPFFLYNLVLFSLFFYVLLNDFITYNVYNLLNPKVVPDANTFFKMDLYNKIISVMCAVICSTTTYFILIISNKLKWYRIIHFSILCFIVIVFIFEL
ncbi:hypothetical protein ASG89_33430 [Paenibacillus sp. Soil766]|nr:hypothetical protein ASG89_33430 [Paenibacillus sp. Soil766]